MYKLIALDMDGTLLQSDHTISQQNKDAIQAARDLGVHVVLASGRPRSGMQAALEELEMTTEQDFVISYNGSLVENVGSQSLIRQEVLTGADAKLLASWAEKLNVNIHAFSTRLGLISPKNSKYTQLECDINGVELTEMPFEQLDDDDVILKVMMVDEEPQLSKAIESLPSELHQKFTIVRSMAFFLEFMNSTSDKGSGVQALAEHLGINASQVITMGDAGNDHHMLEYAGLGIAMGNATPETKAIANYTTASNDEHGVAQAIEKFILNK